MNPHQDFLDELAELAARYDIPAYVIAFATEDVDQGAYAKNHVIGGRKLTEVEKEFLNDVGAHVSHLLGG